MERISAILLIVISFLACDASQQSDAEQFRFPKPSAEDIAAEERRIDLEKRKIEESMKKFNETAKAKAKPEDIKIVTPKELQTHPLVALDKPEDEMIIKYLHIDDMIGACSPDNEIWRKNCESMINDAIKKCAAAGIKTTEDDFRNPVFMDRQAKVLQKQKLILKNMKGRKYIKYADLLEGRLKQFKKGELLQ